MDFDWAPNPNEDSLSVQVLLLFLRAWAATFAVLTALTHLAQIIHLRFEIYAWASAALFLLTPCLVLWAGRTSFTRIQNRDLGVLSLMLALGLLTAALSISLHEFRRTGPDEFFYTANPAFFLKHPSQPLDFSIRLIYSRAEPLHFVAFQTSTAYEYIQAALAHVTGLGYPTVFYVLMAALGGFLIPIGIFLALAQFSRSTLAVWFGTVVTVAVIAMLAEANWVPGSLSFVRAFEGKAIVLFAGLPLFVAFALRHYGLRTTGSWLDLFLLLTALTGLSSTAIMLLPFLGLFIFLACWFLFESNPNPRRFLRASLNSSLAYIYLIAFGLFVALSDKVQNAYALNKFYSTSFDGYVAYFISTDFPLALVLLAVFSPLTLFLTRGKLRTFLLAWMIFVPLFIYNPVASRVLLLFFRGVYFRFAYLYPFPLIVGLCVSALAERKGRYPARIGAGICALAVLIAFLLPTSIFQSRRFAWIPWYDLKEYAVAREAVRIVPEGLMLAPFPVSGAVATLDADHTQMLTRVDTLEVFLSFQGLQADGELRSTVDGFLQDNNDSLAAFLELLKDYPEIESIVMRNEVYMKYRAEIDPEINFPHTQLVGGWRLFWK